MRPSSGSISMATSNRKSTSSPRSSWRRRSNGSDAGDLVDVHGSGREGRWRLRGCGRQFQGNDSPGRCAGWPAIRARTSASHACGSSAVASCPGGDDEPVHVCCARLARSDHAEQPLISVQSATQRNPRSAALFDRQTRPSSRKSVKACQRFGMYWMAFYEVIAPRQFRRLLAHIGHEIVGQGPAYGASDRRALLRALAVDRPLDH